MKQLILKGLGKAKVRKALKLYLIEQFNNHLEYNHKEMFEMVEKLSELKTKNI